LKIGRVLIKYDLKERGIYIWEEKYWEIFELNDKIGKIM